MPRATKEQSEATAAAVRQAGRRLFAERGYAAVPVEEVAAQAGVTRGAVYHHFGSRQGLFEAVHADVQAAVARAVEVATRGVEDLWSSLEVGCRAFLAASLDDDTRRIMLLDGPAVLGWQQWRDVDASNSSRLLEEILTELEGAGRLRPVPVPATSALLSGAMNEAAIWVAQAHDRDAALDHAWTVLRLLLSSLRSGDDARA